MILAKCNKCNGRGRITAFAHVEGGKCFKCNGTGQVKVRKTTRKLSSRKVTDTAKLMKLAMADERVWASPRMNVDKGHPYAEIHAYEVYKWHEKNGWPV